MGQPSDFARHPPHSKESSQIATYSTALKERLSPPTYAPALLRVKAKDTGYRAEKRTNERDILVIGS